MRHLHLKIAIALLAAFAATAGCGGSGDTHQDAAALAGSVSLTNQQWQCNQPVDLDQVSVTLDAAYTGTAADAVKLGPNCTGRIGRIVILTAISDGIKVAGAHDLTIGGGIVDCYGHRDLAHQDGTQVLAGHDITYQGVVFECGSANNSGFYLDPVNGPVTNVVCDGCWLGPTQSSSAFVLDQATNSGVRNSTVCPSRYFDYRHNTALDVNNSYPAAC